MKKILFIIFIVLSNYTYSQLDSINVFNINKTLINSSTTKTAGMVFNIVTTTTATIILATNEPKTGVIIGSGVTFFIGCIFNMACHIHANKEVKNKLIELSKNNIGIVIKL